MDGALFRVEKATSIVAVLHDDQGLVLLVYVDYILGITDINMIEVLVLAKSLEVTIGPVLGRLNGNPTR